MLKIFSKTITATYDTGVLIHQRQRKDPYAKDTEIVTRYTGTKSEIGPDNAGFGSNRRQDQGSRDPEGQPIGFSSGYLDGGPPNDETGPGNSDSGTDSSGLISNEPSMQMEMNKTDRDRINSHVKRVLDLRPIKAPHRRV